MKKIFLSVILLASFMPSIIYAGVKWPSDEQLKKQADLIVSGKVANIERTGLRESSATIKIEKVIKGKIKTPTLIVEFKKLDPYLEADVQDAQFAMGNKGVAYLKRLPNGHYKALGGWLKGWDLK